MADILRIGEPRKVHGSIINEVFSGEEVVFLIERSEKDNGSMPPEYLHIYWNVSPCERKEYYVEQLANFYRSLRDSDFDEGKGLSEDVILMTTRNIKRVPLSYLSTEPSYIFSHESFKSFTSLRVNTPYATFGLYDNEAPFWQPETGILEVFPYVKASQHISELMANTARCQITPERLEPVVQHFCGRG